MRTTNQFVGAAAAVLVLCAACSPPDAPRPTWGDGATSGGSAPLVIGADDSEDLACFKGQPEEAFARSVGRFRPTPLPEPYPASCTGVVLNDKNQFLTSVSCIDALPDRGQIVGTIEMGAAALECGGAASAAPRVWPATLVRADLGLGVMALRAGKEIGGQHEALSRAYPPPAFSQGESGPLEDVAMVAAQGPGALLKVSPRCRVQTWAVDEFYDFGWHDCDADPGLEYWAEVASGAPLFAYSSSPTLPAGAVQGVHLGAWPDFVPGPGGPTNTAISIRELVEEGFFDGLDVGPLAPRDSSRAPPAASRAGPAPEAARGAQRAAPTRNSRFVRGDIPMRFVLLLALVGLCASCAPPGGGADGGERADGVVIGAPDFVSPNCSTHEPFIHSIAITPVAMFTRGDTGQVCATGVLVTQDNLMIVPSRCLSSNPTKLGHATFTAYPSTCDIASPVPQSDVRVYRATDETVGVDPLLGLALVRLGKNHLGQTAQNAHGTAPLGINRGAQTHLAIRADGLVTVATHDQVLLASDGCGLTATGVASHTCDTLGNPFGPETAEGGLVTYARNGCVGPQGVGGLCASGGPQSPGAGVSRMVGVTRGPDASGLANRITFLSELTCQGCLLAPHLTAGNFIP